jgi:hypothetical protein
MPRAAVEHGVLDSHIPRKHPAEIQGCVPFVTLKGKSYRLRERGTAPASAARPAPLEN